MRLKLAQELKVTTNAHLVNKADKLFAAIGDMHLSTHLPAKCHNIAVAVLGSSHGRSTAR